MPAHLPASLFAQDSDSRPYWEGLKQGELRIQRCDSCSQAVFYPRAICPHCHSDQLSWIVASGKGTIYSYTVAHQAFGPFAADVPFIVVLIELEEGARMLSRLLDAPRERVTIGAAVQVVCEQVEEDLTLPYFRLLE
ncbi:MAG TPA: Zn-ribbon domain-containing OB-fold protein [Ktedonobacteraceae bacterium]|nr:Zn-ribbon domain-containing OB-fold protein [Ktedonobacteraceae bacterium]